jgi:hypothetical protein
MEIVIAASKNICQMEPNATVVVDEEDWELKRGAFDMPSNVHFFGRRPSPLRYNGAVDLSNAIVQKRSGLEWGAWRCALHQVDIVRDIPCALTVCYPIVSQEELGRRCPKQAHEVAVCVPGCKCASNESIDEDVGAGWKK